MLLDDEGRELEPGLGAEGGDVDVLAHAASARSARFQGARQARERDADDALLAAGRTYLGRRPLGRRQPAAIHQHMPLRLREPQWRDDLVAGASATQAVEQHRALGDEDAA